MDKLEFKAHFAGFKYLKSNHIWRIELDLFEEDKELIPEQTKFLEKVVTIKMAEWEDPLKSSDLNILLNDPALQVALGVSSEEEAIEAIEKRTSINLSDLDNNGLVSVINQIKDAIK